MAIAGDNVDPDMTRRPRKWDIRAVRNFMVVFGIISSAFDMLTFAVLLFVFHAGPELFRTGWFVESVLTELAIMMVIRTHRPFYRSRPGTLMLISTLVVMALTLALPSLPVAHIFDFVPLPARMMAALVAITALYVIASEVAKLWVYRKP